VNYDARMAQTMEALKDPQVGDRFHEMYSFWLFILAVTPNDKSYLLLADRGNNVAGWLEGKDYVPRG
jgi:hypothetical protein